MTCKQCRAAALDGARAGAERAAEAEAHSRTCAPCAHFHQAQTALRAGLAQVAGTPAPAIPATVQSNVLAAFDGRARHSAVQLWTPPGAAAAAAALALAVAGVTTRHPAFELQAAGAPFVEFPYVAPLAPYERTRIERMDVPVAALIAAGFEVHASNAGAAISAEVLFGQDGRAHAVRLITNHERR